MASFSACEACLTRAWLLGRLAPNIERAANKTKGARVSRLLTLDDEMLIESVAPGTADEVMEERGRASAAEILRAARAAGAEAICIHGSEYPRGLRELDDPPAALFVRGRIERLRELDPHQAVTIVGSRRSSAYGMEVARSLGEEISMAGLLVTSGMALGIDSAVHVGALGGGISCAVLGSGVDVAYPARHRRLYESHVRDGVIVSEMPPGSRAWRWTFPARNRIMAAMAGMTVVVESGRRSGSLITATVAQEVGRDLGAVPGPVTSIMSEGPNELLSQGACVVRNAQDVLDAMLGAGAPRADRLGPVLAPELATALASFEARDGDIAAVASDLADSGIGFEESMAQLELKGYLSRSDIGTWRRTTLKPAAGS